MSDDDFSNHPVSIAEARANKNEDGSLWTPRDALIAALRAIDKGELAPTSLIVAMACCEGENHKGTTHTEYFMSIPNRFYGVGLLTVAVSDITKGGEI